MKKETKGVGVCKICSDRAPRIYYGILSCDGCKSFFRRAVRSGSIFKCRFERNCVITKDRRTQCRYCRLKKCLSAGMKKEAIQNDRDSIRFSIKEEIIPNALSLSSLIHADEVVKEPEGVTLALKIPKHEIPEGIEWTGTVKDHHTSMKEQLKVMVNWAKSIPAFCDLSLEDRVGLLQTRAGEYALLTLVRRSLPLDNVLLLGTGVLITRDSKAVFGVPRILDELVRPLKALRLNDIEFALLKAVLFFDPSGDGLIERGKIESLRRQAQILLEECVGESPINSPGRLSSILLTLLPIQAITGGMVVELKYKNQCGIVNVDKLLREMILGEDVLSNNVPKDVVFSPFCPPT